MIFLLPLAAALLGGGSVGLLGLYVVGLRVPFLGVAMAHAAMAGAVVAVLAGWPMTPAALGAALVAAFGVDWLAAHRPRTDLNTVTSVLLSLMMGLAFLGMGLHQGDMTPLLGLLWGSVLFVNPLDTALMAVAAIAMVLFTLGARRQMDAVLFSRPLARASGVNDRLVGTIFLALAALMITVNLKTVGGMMLYGLLTCPAAAALELAANMRQARWLALGGGILSALAGFGLSWGLNLPTGACIVLASIVIYGLAAAVGHRRAANRQSTEEGHLPQ